MNNIRKGLFWRVIWACSGLVFAANSIVYYHNTLSYSSLILAVGWIFTAVSSFLQPVVLTAILKLSEVRQSQAPYVIGPPLARAIFSLGGFLLLLTGFVLKLVSVVQSF